MGAFVYLVWTSARNRIFSQFRRARSPRYAIALLVGGLYVWAFLFRPTRGPHVGAMFLSRPSEALTTLLLVLTLMGTWVFGSDRTALAFSQAEVSLLFPAPLSRTGLVGYKLFRAQIAVAINTLIWVFVLRRGGTELPSVLRAVSLWVMFSTLNLHRLGAALVRASWSEHGRVGIRRHWPAWLLFGGVVATVLYAIVMGWTRLTSADSPTEMLRTLGDLLLTGPASMALYPFHLIVAPTFAHTVEDWGSAVLPALLVFALHGWWVLRSDAAFEEAAIEASVERARRLEAWRQRRLSPSAPPSGARTIPLAATGRPAVAIVWKNILCLMRTSQLRLFIGPGAMAVALGFAVSGGPQDVGRLISACALALIAMLLLFGGRIIRNDLRHDMLHLPLLKTLPIRGGDVVLAEVASAALPMIGAQVALAIVAYAALGTAVNAPLSPQLQRALILSAPLALVVLNGALMTLQNGSAVLLPAWTRLGAHVGGGVEALGQNVLLLVGTLVFLGIGLIVPGGVGYVIFSVGLGNEAFSLALAIGVGSLILGAETYALMRLLGRVFDRTEPLQTL